MNLPEGWTQVHEHLVTGRPRKVVPYADLELSEPTLSFLSQTFRDGLFVHQREAIDRIRQGNVCLATPTASGKSAVFYVAALEALVQNQAARVLAVYPLKALGREQEQRWAEAISRAGLNANVGRLDGQVPSAERSRIVRNARVLIATPDILHAWLLSNIGNSNVAGFVRNLALIVLDEVHAYSGVFGSNSAFLFRRVQHVCTLMGCSPKFVCASATIANPEAHLQKLTGHKFTLVDEQFDSSPRHNVIIRMVRPPGTRDLLTEVSELLERISADPKNRFIAFADSRKQTELIASILARGAEPDEVEGNKARRDHLQRLGVLPYRAGYEEHDRAAIQERLSNGELRGVVSTSALELGLDIGSLNTGVLIGVPHSTTNLQQRIGRVGRKSTGQVLIINCGDVFDEAMFRKPEDLLARPLAEGALYLENRRIQYIQALCLARHGGEHDQAATTANRHDSIASFTSEIDWPVGFLDLCVSERVGQVPMDLQPMKSEAGDDPNHTFPLRDVERQFRVEMKSGPELDSLGSMSQSQLMREAYPGSVYYYTTRAFRVYRVLQQERKVLVRPEKKYTTSPTTLPTLVFPNLSSGNVHSFKRFGQLLAMEVNLQVRESISGFKERRGSTETSIQYPLDASHSIFFDQSRFARNYFTSGVVLAHSILERDKLATRKAAELIYEAFLIVVPFERADVASASDQYRAEGGPISQGASFLAFYDRTYGSLHLTSRLVETETLRAVLARASEIAASEEDSALRRDCTAILDDLTEQANLDPEDLIMQGQGIAPTSSLTKVIVPGSRGLAIKHDNAEFLVEALFVHPELGLCYRGRFNYMSQGGQAIVPVTSVVEVPGESTLGLYEADTGEVKPLKAN